VIAFSTFLKKSGAKNFSRFAVDFGFFTKPLCRFATSPPQGETLAKLDLSGVAKGSPVGELARRKA